MRRGKPLLRSDIRVGLRVQLNPDSDKNSWLLRKPEFASLFTRVYVIRALHPGGSSVDIGTHNPHAFGPWWNHERLEFANEREAPAEGVRWRVVYSSGESFEWRVDPDVSKADPLQVVFDCTGEKYGAVDVVRGNILHAHDDKGSVTCLRID